MTRLTSAPSTRSLVAVAAALVSIASVTVADGFRVSTRTLSLPETGVVTNWVLQTSKTAFAFMPPSRWQIDPRPGESRLVWASKQYATITLASAPSDLAPPALTNRMELRNSITNRFPHAQIQGELSCYTDSEQGTAFDLTWSDSQGSPMRTRIALVQVTDNVFEFRLTSEEREFSKALPAFTGLLTSFQTVTKD